jgi:hypothetical protein
VMLPPAIATVSVLVGVRYVGVPEEFDYTTVSDVTAAQTYVPNGSINELRVSTRNEMVGPQVGTLIEFYGENRWWMDFEIKGALLNNNSRVNSYYRNVNNGVTTVYESSDSGSTTSILTDLSFTCVYRWSPHFTTRLGYRAVWLTNVALAQDNFSDNIDLYRSSISQLNDKASTFYQGPFLGADFNW